MEIGHKLKELRLKNELTLEELASRSEVTKGFLSQLERDLTSPNIAALENILEALGTTLGEFFKEEEDKRYVFTKEDPTMAALRGCEIVDGKLVIHNIEGQNSKK